MEYKKVQTIREAVTCAVKRYEWFVEFGHKGMEEVGDREVNNWRRYLADDRLGRINKLKEI